MTHGTSGHEIGEKGVIDAAESPCVSVIIPVYQVEKFLPRCVDSVLAQTHREIQVILIDDGSTDSSSAICDRYTELDDRVDVVHQRNCGLAAARNKGIELARGEWLTFVDSDDWIHEQMIANLLNSAAQDVDVVVGGFQRVSDDQHLPNDQLGSIVRLSPEEALEQFLGIQHTLLTISCAKLFRRQLFDDIRFPEGRLHEDEFTTHRLLATAQATAVDSRRMYFYFQNPQSITGAGLSIRHHRDRVEAFRQQLYCIEAAGYSQLVHKAQYNLLIKLLQMLQELTTAGLKGELAEVANEVRYTSRRIPVTRLSPRAAILVTASSWVPKLTARLYAEI